MPHIPQEERRFADLQGHADRLGNSLQSPGQLNFAITRVVLAYLGDDPHYSDYRGVLGDLVCVILELYRCKVAPYEDLKIIQNESAFK